MTQYYVYELIDPRDESPFYIGKGNGDRMYKHKKQAYQHKGSKINPHKSNKIKQILESGNDLRYKKYNCDSELEAFNLEQQLIIQYGKRVDNTGILTNLTDGGEGYTGGRIPVKQYNLFGEYIQTHRSAKDAALFLGKPYYSQITGSCKRKETSAYGFLWSYIDKQPILRTKIKTVYQWTLGGIFVNKFESIANAAKILNMDPSNIPNAINRQRQSNGYVWSYEKIFPGIAPNKKLKSVLHINTGIIYDSITKAATALGHNIGAISKCCSGKKNDIGGNRFRYTGDGSDQC